jgi:hypothetical protein
MKIVSFLSAMLMFSPLSSHAQGAPLIGSEKADSYQRCGKNISLQIKNVANDFIVIGLMNKKTNNMDFFKSTEQKISEMNYTKYNSVRFDALSNTFVNTDNSDLDILWGSSLNDKKQVTYHLVLGSEVYECGPIQKWPSETANVLYGEDK